MPTTETLVIGAGQAGLALSHELTVRGRDHVVLERGRAGERWRSERPASLRLLTPNWMTRLPGFTYAGGDPDGYMTTRELAGRLERWSVAFGAPVQSETSVLDVSRAATGGYRVRTDQGTWRAAQVVVATGFAQVAAVPAFAAGLHPCTTQVTPTTYSGPADLPAGGVLVVGASASGLQIAEELALAGRRTVLAVGRHIRLPRRYRGMDVLWWLDRMGLLDTDVRDLADPVRAERQPSWQLVGRPTHDDLDLAVARRLGVELVGRVVGTDGTTVRFAPDLVGTVAEADAALGRLLGRIDQHIDASGLAPEVDAPTRPAPVAPPPGRTELDLRAAGISSVVWATGYRRSYPWLRVPVVDRRGDIVQRRGVTASPGLFTVGMRHQTNRGSATIDGVRHDAREIAAHIEGRPVTNAGRASTTGVDR